ncbi:NAD(P)-dependent oxidoreductase [Nocardia sp. CY41]|uniref:NAD(P)-dependent oxidoreductase n=1 Tax=Nocardia sp. CY41 TaxID=2608686 RepID=UPI00135693B7|nr:NAD(P)H-binding protein [Nocardia sp. CY41]
MKIAVVGANGMVGSRVIAEAVSRGHEIVAVFRRQPPTSLPPGVSAVEGDANDADRMSAVFDGVDAIVAATRPAPGQEHTVTATTAALLNAARTTRSRVLVVGGAAPLRASEHSDRLVLDNPEYVPAAIRPIAAASVAQWETCRTHPADSVYLSPPALLEPGRRTGKYRRGAATLIISADGSSRISAEDLAVAVLDELESPGRSRHFTVGY